MKTFMCTHGVLIAPASFASARLMRGKEKMESGEFYQSTGHFFGDLSF